ncbi:pentapeptide repeat-containing protein [Thalassococcus sp. BH17M4-6]|uniref:pentapeptide repeat-containing protein n=1 Tax=Thalassococcus sp. BH17M4-6 TaxID=3413148 RepID=UPI003BCDF0D7
MVVDLRFENGTLSGSLGLPGLMALLVLLGALAFTIRMLRKGGLHLPARFARVPADFGLPDLWPPFFWTAVMLWVGLMLTLTAGLFGLIFEVLFHSVVRAGDSDAWNFRFLLAQMVALTGVLGAVVALPFTLLKLSLSRAQTTTAQESLFNDKINATTTDLYAQRQISEEERQVWQDDVLRRNAALDRLEALVVERPQEARRISRLLSVYIRELSREFPAQTHPYLQVFTLTHPQGYSRPLKEEEAFYELGIQPADAELHALSDWAEILRPVRSDMESAAQILGRLGGISGVDRRSLEIDLRHANLQGFHLNGSDFSGARLAFANTQGVRLNNAKLCNADLHRAQLQGARLERANLEHASLDYAGLEVAVFDGARMTSANLNRSRLDEAYLCNADLRQCRLMSANLGAARLDGAVLTGARMDHANLSTAGLVGTQLDGVLLDQVRFSPSTAVKDATFKGSALRLVNCSFSEFQQAQIDQAFGDASVRLGDLKRPTHWSDKTLSPDEFATEWHAYQRSIGMDPDDPT